jgi:hypothetical protein
MTPLNGKTAPFYRKGVSALVRLNRRIDRWSRRFPRTTALLCAALALVLIIAVNGRPR